MEWKLSIEQIDTGLFVSPFLTDIHFWGELDHVGAVVQKSSVDQSELEK